jgi:hypothetical protein
MGVDSVFLYSVHIYKQKVASICYNIEIIVRGPTLIGHGLVFNVHLYSMFILFDRHGYLSKSGCCFFIYLVI